MDKGIQPYDLLVLQSTTSASAQCKLYWSVMIKVAMTRVTSIMKTINKFPEYCIL